MVLNNQEKLLSISAETEGFINKEIDSDIMVKENISRSRVLNLMLWCLLKELGFNTTECDICKKGNIKLIIHHKDKNPLNNNKENLRIICWVCHAKVHEIGKRQNKRIGKLNSNWKNRLKIVKCDNCEKFFLKRIYKYGKYKHTFCCRKCASIFRMGKGEGKKQKEFICVVCGKKFEDVISKKRKFCSLKCAYGNRNRDIERIKNRIKKICLICNKEFKIIPSKKETTKYCSKECRNEGLKIRDGVSNERRNYLKHRNEILKEKKEYYKKNKEKIKKKRRIYYYANKNTTTN